MVVLHLFISIRAVSMFTGLAFSVIVGLALGMRFRAAMLLMSSLMVLILAFASQWEGLVIDGEAFWTLLRMWLWLAAHQLGFVVGSCLAEAAPARLPDHLPPGGWSAPAGE
jgi:hypothetical protein